MEPCKANLVADCSVFGQDGDAPLALYVIAVHDALLSMLTCSEHFALLEHGIHLHAMPRQ